MLKHAKLKKKTAEILILTSKLNKTEKINTGKAYLLEITKAAFDWAASEHVSLFCMFIWVPYLLGICLWEVGSL